MNRKTINAYHEAGHALLFLLRKRKFSKVVLGLFPEVDEGRDTEIDSYDSAIITLEISAAGIIAEGIKEGREISINELETWFQFEGLPENKPIAGPIEINKDTSESIKALIYICRTTPGEEKKVLIKRIYFRTRNLLLKRWKDIETIASALLEKGELNFDDPVFKQIAKR